VANDENFFFNDWCRKLFVGLDWRFELKQTTLYYISPLSEFVLQTSLFLHWIYN